MTKSANRCWAVVVHMKDGSFCDLILYKSKRKAVAHGEKIMQNCATILDILYYEVVIRYIN